MVPDGGEARRRLTTVLAADVVGYSRLMGIDEQSTFDALKRLRGLALGEAMTSRAGRLANTAGDSLLLEFPSAVEAVRYAVELQRAIAEADLSVAGRPMRLRIGINIGDVFADGDDLIGDGVNVAARIEAMAPSGGVAISRAVRDQVRDRLDLVLEDLGEVEVKNVARAVRLFRVAGLGEPGPLPAAGSPAKGGRRRIALRAVAAVAVAAVLAAAASWFGPTLSHDERSPRRVAVLNFADRSADGDQGYFAAGVAEDIATSLSRVDGLEVTPPRGPAPADPVAAASALGASHALAGSVRRSDRLLRVTARLVQADDGAQLWARNWDRPDQDLFGIQDEIAALVTEALSGALGDLGPAPERVHEPRIEAYDAYVAGRAKRIPPTPENLAAALALFERAAELDPNFAGGPAGASFVHALYAFHPDPPLGKGGHLAEALRLGERATALDPDFGPAHGALAEALVRLGRHDEALAAVGRAIELAPADALMRARRGRFLAWAGEPEAGIEDIRASLRMAPDSPPPLYFLGLAQRAAGAFDDAAATLEEHRERLGGRFALAPNLHLLAAYVQSGMTAKAATLAEEIERRAPWADLAHADEVNPWRRDADRDDFLEALRAGGLPR